MTSVRGGSKLFHSLLDFHPQIVSFPRTFQFNRFWREINLSKYNIEEIADLFCENYPRFFDGKKWSDINPLDKAENLGEGFNETFTVSKKEFKNQLLKLSIEHKPINSRNLFVDIHVAYHYASGRDLISNSIILYHIHAVKQLKELTFCIDDFQCKHVKLVFITKHPLEGLRSIVKWMGNVSSSIKSRPGILYYYLDEIYNGINRVSDMYENLDVKIVMLDQMINDRDILLKQFTSWLKIDWKYSLLTPTLHGKLWWGNSKRPINKSIKNKKNYHPKGLLEINDWRIMSAIFPKRIESYGLIPHDTSPKSQSNIRLYLLSLLPMHCEWCLLKSIINRRIIKRIFRDIDQSVNNTSPETDNNLSFINTILIKANSTKLFSKVFFNFIFQFFMNYSKRISLTISLLGDNTYPDTDDIKRLLTTD